MHVCIVWMHAWFCVNEFTSKPTDVSLNFVCQDRQNDAGDTLQSTLSSLQALRFNHLVKDCDSKLVALQTIYAFP